MGSAIWKLSALATVVGLGMVGVVVQQRGLLGTGKPAANPEAKNADGKQAGATPSAPTPNVPKAGAEKNPAGDPFSDKETADSQDAAPGQASLTETAPDLSDATATNDTENSNFTDTEKRTKPRTPPRGINLKDEVMAGSSTGPEGSQFDEQSVTGDSEFAQDSGSAQGVDASELEGSAASDSSADSLTDESDPFAKHKAALQTAETQSRGTRNGSRTGSRSTESAAATESEFDTTSSFEKQASPVVPAARPPAGGTRERARASLVDDAGSATDESAEGRGTDFADDQSNMAPAGYRAEVPGAGKSPPAAKRGRPRIDPDEDFKTTTQGPPNSPVVASPPAPRTGNIQKRPNPLKDEDDDTSLPRTSRPGAVQGPAVAPKLIYEPATSTDQAMPPAVSKSKSGRPNPLLDDEDDPGTATIPRQPKSNPPVTERTITNPRGPVDSSDFDTPPPVDTPKQRPTSKFDDDENSPLSGTPDAAASRSSVTDIRESPQSSDATGSYPSTSPRAAGRGRVSIEKLAPPTAYVGQPMVYAIKVKNVGNAPAHQVVIEDELPEGVAMQGSTLQAEMTGRKLAWKLGSLAAGEERKISVKVVPGKAGSTGTAARVRFMAEQRYASADSPEQDVAVTGQRTASTTSRTVPRTSPRSAESVQLEMQRPGPIATNQQFELKFRLTNRSDQPVTNLLVLNSLPPGVTHESLYEQLKYEVKSLAPGDSLDMPLVLTAVQSGRAVCRATVKASDGRVIFSEDFAFEVAGGSFASGSTGTAGAARPNLAVEVLSPNEAVQVGSWATYEIRLTNRGLVPVRQGIIRVSVPQELRLVNAGPLSYRQEGTDLIFEPIPALEAGQQATVKAEFIAEAAGDTFVSVQTQADHLKRPLSRKEDLSISER